MRKKLQTVREKWWYAAAFLGMFLSDRALPLCPLSVGLGFALSFAGFSPFPVAVLSTLSLLIAFPPAYAILAAVGSLGMALVFSIYQRRQAAVGGESILFLCFFLLPYVAFAGESGGELVRAVRALFALCLGVLGKSFFPELFRKKALFRPGAMQMIMGGAVAVVLVTGVYRAFGGTVFTAIGTVFLLFGVKFFGAFGAIAAGVFSLPVLFFTGSFLPLGVYFLAGVGVYVLTPTGRVFPALFLPAYTALLSVVFGVFPLMYAQGGAVAAGALLYLFTPPYFVQKAEKALSVRQEHALSRNAVNRQRQSVAASLYSLSAVFREIQGLFVSAAPKESEEEVCRILATQTMQSVCTACPAHEVCVGAGKVREGDFIKTLAIGLAKGRVSILDFTGEVAKTCAYQSNLLFCMNQLLSRYREKMESRENADVGKKLLAEESGGVAEVLEKLAATYAVPFVYDKKKEHFVYGALAERGVFPMEIMVQKEGAVSLLLHKKEGALAPKLAPILSRVIGKDVALSERVEVEKEHCIALYRPAPKYGAAIGLAGEKKRGSLHSGDTHSALKMGVDGMLVAISDGMGSGNAAGQVSSSAIGLIESFYRAGFSSETLLSTVNKLLSCQGEETFAAVDIATLSLSTGKCVFFKIGAPYGFVLKKEGALVVEGNSLPLGILEDIAPEAHTCVLSPGDTLLLFSDGVTDAFGTASDFLDFIVGEKGRNPQALAESVLARAKSLTGGECKDDMTVLALRLYEKSAC